jgi:hypothetical protein
MRADARAFAAGERLDRRFMDASETWRRGAPNQCDEILLGFSREFCGAFRGYKARGGRVEIDEAGGRFHTPARWGRVRGRT